ncbi:tol-pal system protein YbgF [uncultured Aquabacterium sp.]|uniref:tol-pal system protein YbgF n=1 Tax=Aquabacterium sp. TaxID=1872578 RepID=UPI0025E68783|nr:tol-pal system protein YbgF [uncultured Aquabacterium sp.]
MTLLPPFATRLRPLVLALAAACLASAAQAGLFEDADARRAILDLRQQRTQDADALASKLGALNAQIEQLRRSLLEMNAQIEQLRGDLAKQRGQDEVLARDLAEVQRKLKDTQASVDERVRKLEPQTLTVDGKTFKADPDEKRLFDDALARLRAADFAAGVAGLNGLLQRYPSTGYRESAWYWSGNAHYGLRQYKEAITAFRQLVDKAPEHARAPEALLSIANCQGELKDNEAARRTLEELVKQYPSTEAAQAARDRLLTMPAPTKGAAAPKKARG